MANLQQAHRELYRRGPDECFPTFEALHEECRQRHQTSVENWQVPQRLVPSGDSTLQLTLEDDSRVELNDWSFGQLCGLCGIQRQTINRLRAGTASQVLAETLPRSQKPIQILTTGSLARAVHGVSYTRLWNDELLDVIAEFRSDFEPPPVAADGQGTGLYSGEQDLFAFLIDPDGWTEIGAEQFAPGFFVWNSEVGRRSLGLQTFWYQRVCGNHIVWDAVEVVEFSRKHTSHVHDALEEIRRQIERLVSRRDQRRDQFATVIGRAMQAPFGDDEEQILNRLSEFGISKRIAQQAIPSALVSGGGRATLFSMVDALTRASGSLRFAGDRTDLDTQISRLLSLVV